jgi:cytochrome b
MNQDQDIKVPNTENKHRWIKVWDPFVRLFHWATVIFFSAAYITEDDFLFIHSWSGYILLTLIMLRIIWGFVGTQYARFSNFSYSLSHTKTFLKNTLSFKAKRYIGHNPAGGLMIFALLLVIGSTALSGIVLIALEEQQGPLVYLFDSTKFTSAPHFLSSMVEALHEFFAHTCILLIFCHVCGVIIESLIHKENLAKSMVTGLKRPEE